MRPITASMLLLSSLLYADYTVVYQMGNSEEPHERSTTTFYYEDAQHSRVDTSIEGDDTSSTMLVSGDKAYMISYEDGQPHVMDMDALVASIKSISAGMLDHEEADPNAMKAVKWNDTGTSKTVGGIKGEVWQAMVDEHGKTETYEVVLTDNPDYVKAVEAFEAMMKRMANAEGSTHTEMFTMVKPGYVPIEINQGQLALRSFSQKKIDAERFLLPAGAAVEKNSLDTQDGVDQETRDSINENVDSAVKAIKSLF